MLYFGALDHDNRSGGSLEDVHGVTVGRFSGPVIHRLIQAQLSSRPPDSSTEVGVLRFIPVNNLTGTFRLIFHVYLQED